MISVRSKQNSIVQILQKNKKNRNINYQQVIENLDISESAFRFFYFQNENKNQSDKRLQIKDYHGGIIQTIYIGFMHRIDKQTFILVIVSMSVLSGPFQPLACHSVCSQQEGGSLQCAMVQSNSDCITCDSSLKTAPSSCDGKDTANGDPIITRKYVEINQFTSLSDRITNIFSGGTNFTSISDFTTTHVNADGLGQFFLKEAGSPLDIGFDLAGISARAYGIKIKIAGIKSSSCNPGIKNTISFNWVDEWGQAGTIFIDVIGTPFNRAFPTIPLMVSAASQTFTFTIANAGSADGSCNKLFISDMTIIVQECDASCVGCNSVVSCSCDYTISSFLLNTNTCGGSCGADFVNTATSTCVSSCGLSEYAHPLTSFCTACPVGCSNCTMTADRFSPSLICLDPVAPTSINTTAASDSEGASMCVKSTDYFQLVYHKQCLINSIELSIEGIISIILAVGIFIYMLTGLNRKIYHQIMAYIMLLQVIGLIRIKVDLNDTLRYSVLHGYSYFELPFLPNAFSLLFSNNYQEDSFSSVAYAVGNHNLILNIGSIIQAFLFFQICLAIYYVIKRDQILQLKKIKLYQQTLVIIFMVITIYFSFLSLISLNIDNVYPRGTEFWFSICLSLLLILIFFIYMVISVIPFISMELYKINNIFRAIGVVILSFNLIGSLVVLNANQLVFIFCDAIMFRRQKINMVSYMIERIVIIIALNVAILVSDYIPLIIILGLLIALVFGIKIYYMLVHKEKEELGQMQVADSFAASPSRARENTLKCETKQLFNTKTSNISEEIGFVPLFQSSRLQEQFTRKGLDEHPIESEQKTGRKEEEIVSSTDQFLVYYNPRYEREGSLQLPLNASKTVTIQSKLKMARGRRLVQLKQTPSLSRTNASQTMEIIEPETKQRAQNVIVENYQEEEDKEGEEVEEAAAAEAADNINKQI